MTRNPAEKKSEGKLIARFSKYFSRGGEFVLGKLINCWFCVRGYVYAFARHRPKDENFRVWSVLICNLTAGSFTKTTFRKVKIMELRMKEYAYTAITCIAFTGRRQAVTCQNICRIA
jgi:hypothetical protein